MFLKLPNHSANVSPAGSPTSEQSIARKKTMHMRLQIQSSMIFKEKKKKKSILPDIRGDMTSLTVPEAPLPMKSARSVSNNSKKAKQN